MMWRQEATEIVANATRRLPDDTPLPERKKVINDACPSSWRMMS
ncbi:hypothetical protein [Paracoccus beibuensis]|nr:hypothetical protein [Paracoccus beibuensis]